MQSYYRGQVSDFQKAISNLREFMLTTVILAPGACWGGSDPPVLAQSRCKTGQCRPAPARTGKNWACSRNIWFIYGRKIKAGCSIFETGCSFFVFFHRCARHPAADPPARRPVARIAEKIRPPMAKYGQYRAKHGPPQKNGQKLTIYTAYIAYI